MAAKDGRLRSIELQADSLVIDRRGGGETVTLDRVVEWAIASRVLWSELQLRLDEGRRQRLRCGPARWRFGAARDSALLEVRFRRMARTIAERLNGAIVNLGVRGQAAALSSAS